MSLAHPVPGSDVAPTHLASSSYSPYANYCRGMSLLQSREFMQRLRVLQTARPLQGFPLHQRCLCLRGNVMMAPEARQARSRRALAAVASRARVHPSSLPPGLFHRRRGSELWQELPDGQTAVRLK